ncbi:hypothetical protein [Rhizobium herbae]|uniref:AbiV family abortive infection protein n=1 Tax=Rhizobium herbae TaxID=508661 RepID=A0ABS4EGS1_9HYPH|nr:hypothetical protein [Rhizobium herbae]MBP1857140.1 hypothetical protein [Rhizobium herbae]
MSTEAFDLNELARKLSKDQRYSRQARIIEEFSSACSILQDLKVAFQSLMSLVEIQGDDFSRQEFSQSLMMHAVISYCRGLVSRTNNRRTIDVVGKAYSKEQKVMHMAIADLRSTALAHYNKPLGLYAAEWLDDRAVVIRREGAFEVPKDVVVRKNYTKIAVEALADLLETALQYIGNERDRRSEEAWKVLKDMEGDVHFSKLLSECRFHPDEYFSSNLASEAFWLPGDFESETHMPRPGLRAPERASE